MKLLVDFGNTRLKWAIFDHGRMQPGGVFAHAGKALQTELRSEWATLARVRAAVVASVVALAREQELREILRERFGVDPAFLRSPAYALGVRNAYHDPSMLGIDRFLALAALHDRLPRAQVLAGAGTALTLDALGADGRHFGGVIVASPHLMRAAVSSGTARVGATEGHFEDLPDNTADAVASGALYAAAGAIDRFRAVAAMRLGTPPVIVLTGGGADEIAPFVPPVERAHDLVLRGLALWAGAMDH